LASFAIPVIEHLDQNYERLNQVGEGTYGKVYKAKRLKDNSLVALKRVRIEAEKEGVCYCCINT
jgi:hypothetical protein